MFYIYLQELLEKRSEMMNDYKRFRERASAEWDRMKFRRLELRGGRTSQKKEMRKYINSISRIV